MNKLSIEANIQGIAGVAQYVLRKGGFDEKSLSLKSKLLLIIATLADDGLAPGSIIHWLDCNKSTEVLVVVKPDPNIRNILSSVETDFYIISQTEL